MTIANFLALVAELRAAQIDYYKSPGRLKLIKSKQLEKEVDQVIRAELLKIELTKYVV